MHRGFPCFKARRNPTERTTPSPLCSHRFNGAERCCLFYGRSHSKPERASGQQAELLPKPRHGQSSFRKIETERISRNHRASSPMDPSLRDFEFRKRHAPGLLATRVRLSLLQRLENGGGGIRTHEGLSSLPVFKTGAFNHSATPPTLSK
jgi:hypothetical protein